MTFLVITGGIACGKSFFFDLFKEALRPSALYFSADDCVKALLQQADVCYELCGVLGRDICDESESGLVLNRHRLRQKVFGDELALRKLESVIHPRVLAALDSFKNGPKRSELFLAEVPLHYEIKETVEADLVIVVASSQTVQIKRLMERRGLDLDMIKKILKSQWTIEAKVEKADLVIWNDGESDALATQALTLARQFSQT